MKSWSLPSPLLARVLVLVLLSIGSATGCSGPKTGPDAGIDPEAACHDKCASLSVCPEVSLVACAQACTQQASRECLMDSQNCLGAGACEDLIVVTPERAFDPGPYGLDPRTVAGPLVLPTLEGTFDFEALWSGRESFVFANYAAGFDYTEQLWASDPGALLDSSPSTVHYVFLAYRDSSGADRAAEHVGALKTRFEAAFAGRPLEVIRHWRDHLHFVTTPAREVEGWVGSMLRARSSFAFAIDRQQRIRNVGYLARVGGAARLAALGDEARYFDWERTRDAALDPRDRVITLARQTTTRGTLFFSTQLPPAEEVARYDRLLVDLSLDCPGGLDSNCGEWDYLASLRLCDGAGTCEIELGRWVTPYSRAGRWVSDLTPILPHLKAGGLTGLRFHATHQPDDKRYLVSLDLRLGTEDPVGPRPSEIVPLWEGGRFDENYDSLHLPMNAIIPSDVVKVELVVVVSGHGFGADRANCAEFCNHMHVFTINGHETTFDHPEAGTPEGCQQRVGEGVVPNQFGTWPFGRGGWCPGLDIPPRTVDITAQVVPGERAALSYHALVDGVPYVPELISNPSSGFSARVELRSWLLYWR